MKRTILAVALMATGLCGVRPGWADLIDDASVNGIGSYTRSATATYNQGAVVNNAGAYHLAITGTTYQAWYYPGERFTSSNAGFTAKLWVQSVDTPETTEDRTHHFLTWGVQTNEAAFQDPANRYAVGYAARFNGRQNFVYQGGNAVTVRQKKPGNLGAGLYREPIAGSLVTQVGGVQVGAVNPEVHYRLEWRADQVNGTNRFVAAIYQGSSAEFTDTATLKGVTTNLVTDANVLTAGYLGFGVYREQTAAAGPVTRIHRIEFRQLPAAVPPTMGTAILVR